MQCQFCQGTGKLWIEKDISAGRETVCFECGGSGIGYCCDGLCEQPQPQVAHKEWPEHGSDGLYDPIKIHNG